MKNNLKNLTLILYTIYIVSIFIGGFLSIVALIVNYLKIKDVQGTIYQSHFRWQIRTFWWYFALMLLGILPFLLILNLDNFIELMPITLTFGVPVILIATIWNIYRLVKGMLKVIDQQEIS